MAASIVGISSSGVQVLGLGETAADPSQQSEFVAPVTAISGTSDSVSLSETAKMAALENSGESPQEIATSLGVPETEVLSDLDLSSSSGASSAPLLNVKA